MNRIYSMKACVLLVVILFLGSPIISSISNQTQQLEIRTLGNNPDPKIAAAIELVTEDLLREFLTVLTVDIGPRYTGTYGCEEAAKYIYEQFENMGLETRYHDWESWTYRSKKFMFFESQNVEATLSGIDNSNDEVIVFNAHYDSTRNSPGAIDDGSGTVAVIAAAYALSHFEFNRTIKFVTFSGEEVGLLGSRNYVRDIYKADTDIFVEFNADMIGYANTSEEGTTIYVSRTPDAEWVFDEISNVSEEYGIGFDVKNAWNISAEGTRHGSDFFDFVLHGYESVAFWESGRYEYWHSEGDSIDKVNFSYLTNVTKLIVASLAHLADIETYYPQIKIGAPKWGRVYYEDKTLKERKYERTTVFDDVLICTEVKPGDAPIEKVEFYYDGKLMNIDTEPPYQWRLNKFSIRMHTVEVKLYDELGRTASDKVTFRYINLNTKK